MEEKRWLGHLALWTAMVSSRARKPPEDGQAEGSPIFPYRSAITLLDFWVFGSY